MYVNGKEVGSTTVDQWDQTERMQIAGDVASCSSQTVYAIDTTDGSGVAGVIATINHCPGPPGAVKRPQRFPM